MRSMNTLLARLSLGMQTSSSLKKGTVLAGLSLSGIVTLNDNNHVLSISRVFTV